MRAALWLLALFAIAVAVALFAGTNQGTITVFWPPWRVDLSLNLVLLLLVGLFVLLYAALRALATLFDLPAQAHRWRLQQRERAMHAAMLDALSHLMAGRFIRARKAAQTALAHEGALTKTGHGLANASQMRALAHLLAAEGAHALQDRGGRDEHLREARAQVVGRSGTVVQETREGVQLQSARWALDDHDARSALASLEELPQGAGRRTLALRMRLKATRLAHQTADALETARALARHRAFSPAAAHSIVRGLATELLNAAHDPAQLEQAWGQLDAAERAMPELAIHAAQRMVGLQGDAATARAWLLPTWERMLGQDVGSDAALRDPLRVGRRACLPAGVLCRWMCW